MDVVVRCRLGGGARSLPGRGWLRSREFRTPRRPSARTGSASPLRRRGGTACGMPCTTGRRRRRRRTALRSTCCCRAGDRRGAASTWNVWTPDPGAGGLPVFVSITAAPSSTAGGDRCLRRSRVRPRRHRVRDDQLPASARTGFSILAMVPAQPTEGCWTGLAAALGWVQDNIAAFGGDPTNVTVCGGVERSDQRCTLLSMPSTRGLFQAGGAADEEPGTALHSAATGTKVTGYLAEMLGVAPASGEEVAAVSLERLIEAQFTPAVQVRTAPDPQPLGRDRRQWQGLRAGRRRRRGAGRTDRGHRRRRGRGRAGGFELAGGDALLPASDGVLDAATRVISTAPSSPRCRQRPASRSSCSTPILTRSPTIFGLALAATVRGRGPSRCIP